MFFKQLFTPGLAHCYYVIGGKKECLVVDPPRDIDTCLKVAKEFGLPITGIIETHLHADFVSGHMDLAEETGAVIYAAKTANCEFPHKALQEGETVIHDTLVLGILDTPGHTPEGAVFLVADLERAEEPILVFSGDTVLVGDVGRPDLFPDQKNELAEKLYYSLEKIKKLPDNLELYPAHGMGSLCGRALSAKLSSTLGTEKKYNYALKIEELNEFKNALLEGMPEAPDHFARCSEINRQGPPLVKHLEKPKALNCDEVERMAERGGIILDVRSSFVFTAGHIPGAYSIPEKSNFSTFAGWILPPDESIVLVGESKTEIEQAIIKLSRVGLDGIGGYLDGGMEKWINQGRKTEQLETISVHRLRDMIGDDDKLFLDTRLKSEWDEGYIAGTMHAPTHELRHLFTDLPPDKPIVVFCNTSNRSILGASILKRRGFINVTQVIGGTTGWENAGYSLVNDN